MWLSRLLYSNLWNGDHTDFSAACFNLSKACSFHLVLESPFHHSGVLPGIDEFRTLLEALMLEEQMC